MAHPQVVVMPPSVTDHRHREQARGPNKNNGTNNNTSMTSGSFFKVYYLLTVPTASYEYIPVPTYRYLTRYLGIYRTVKIVGIVGGSRTNVFTRI